MVGKVLHQSLILACVSAVKKYVFFHLSWEFLPTLIAESFFEVFISIHFFGSTRWSLISEHFVNSVPLAKIETLHIWIPFVFRPIFKLWSLFFDLWRCELLPGCCLPCYRWSPFKEACERSTVVVEITLIDFATIDEILSILNDYDR